MSDDFMSDDEGGGETYMPDGGENAVILQPGTTTIATTPSAMGPSLYRVLSELDKFGSLYEPCEFAVTMQFVEDAEFISDWDLWQMDDEQWAGVVHPLEGNKIGGSPAFYQAAFPDENPWHLLLQLDSTQVPFRINFGDAGVGYAFLSTDGLIGKFLWECA